MFNKCWKIQYWSSFDAWSCMLKEKKNKWKQKTERDDDSNNERMKIDSNRCLLKARQKMHVINIFTWHCCRAKTSFVYFISSANICHISGPYKMKASGGLQIASQLMEYEIKVCLFCDFIKRHFLTFAVIAVSFALCSSPNQMQTIFCQERREKKKINSPLSKILN